MVPPGQSYTGLGASLSACHKLLLAICTQDLSDLRVGQCY